jgi:membrane associated rhomboid family serine protease
MLIPWGSDAPLYHRPIATIGVIVVCTLSFFLFPAGEFKDWTLVLGDGLHPIQWVTALFMHIGIGHLVGNLIFLWAFGIIVEGKLGWWAFLLSYLGIGVIENAALQFVVRPSEPVHALGASGAIFGLLAMCLVWAPRNEIQCIAIFRLLPMDFDFPILGFVAFYVGMEVFFLAVGGFRHSSELAHVVGAVLGFLLACVLLKFNLVDCENWDLFAILDGRQGQTKAQARKTRAAARRPTGDRDRPARPKRKAKRAEQGVESIEDASGRALRTMRLHLEMGEIEAALAVHEKSSRSIAGWKPDERDWIDLIQALVEQGNWDSAVPIMRDYLKNTAKPSPRVQLKLAQVLIQKRGRPLQGLKVLEQIRAGSLPDKLELARKQLTDQAEQMREDGELELQDEMW